MTGPGGLPAVPEPGGWLHAYTQLSPATMPLAPVIEPRPEQVYKALGLLMGMCDVWHARGQGHTLDAYNVKYAPNGGTLTHTAQGSRYVPGAPNPAANLRQYRPFHQAVEDAADILRHPHGGTA